MSFCFCGGVKSDKKKVFFLLCKNGSNNDLRLAAGAADSLFMLAMLVFVNLDCNGIQGCYW